MTIRALFLSALLLPALLVSCTPEDLMPTGNPAFRDDGDIPGFVSEIRPYDGRLAADAAAADEVGTGDDYFWELNGNNGSDFSKKIEVKYNGNTAEVSASDVSYTLDGAHVELRMEEISAEIVLQGQSADGSLKIYGNKRIKLTLNGVDLTSSRGPAINNQNKKVCFVHLMQGTVNRLTDAAAYADDSMENADEDSKGCFFSEGSLSFSGSGVLVVRGRHRHGIAVDRFFYVRPGVTIAVTEAAKNAIHVKGNNGFGIHIAGGLVYAHTAADAGKCLKSELRINIYGGELDLNTSGKARFDTDEEDTSSPSCIKSDDDIVVRSGVVSAKSTGAGGKGLNAAGNIIVSGGTITVSTSGNRYVYRELTSSPKGIKADGDITVDGGTVHVATTGKNGGAEGIDGKSMLTVNGGNIYVYACDDAITASELRVNDGRIFAYSVRNDGVVASGPLSVTGGCVIASGSTSVSGKRSFYCKMTDGFEISGGTLLGTGGLVTLPAAGSTQKAVVYNGLTVSKGENVALLDDAGSLLAACAMPRSMEGMTLFFSAPSLLPGITCTACKGGQVSESAGSWHGWYDGGRWSGGSPIGRVTCSGPVSVAGN